LRRIFFIIPVVHLFKGYVLDIGCGTGSYLECYSGLSLGIDAHENNVKICTEKGIKAIIADANTFMSEDRFDTVLLSHVLEHLENPQRVIENAIKSTKTGGRIIIIVPCMEGFLAGFGELGNHKQFISENYVDGIMRNLHCKKINIYTFPPVLGGQYEEMRMIFEKQFDDEINSG
jgi:SAM-dependent methyltransferase